MALHKIIDKIMDYDDAVMFAALAHGNQCDLKGRPYIMHPLRVSEAVWMKELSSEAVCAAVLHDTVEDNAQVTTALIEALAGPRVGHLVDLLTRREGQSYSQFIDRIVQSRDFEAAQIKMCDIEDNMREDRRLNVEGEWDRRMRYLEAYGRLENVENTGDPVVPSVSVGNKLREVLDAS